MTPCTRARLQTAVLRLLTGAVASLAVWLAARPVADYFQWQISEPMAIGAGAVAGLLALLVSWRVFNFTQDCMSIPDADSPHGSHGHGRCHRRACELRFENSDPAEPQPAPAIVDSLMAPTRPTAPVLEDRPDSITMVATDRISVQLQPQSPESARVIVIVRGFTSSQFKRQGGIRARLQQIPGVSWSNPVNKGDGVRVMEGLVSESAAGEDVLAKIQEVAEHFS